jgi:hypothetical protein
VASLATGLLPEAIYAAYSAIPSRHHNSMLPRLAAKDACTFSRLEHFLYKENPRQ